ncbi:MAG: hypothetical protein E7161_00480 [Firmicutes bacterium]|nr:hypothetical protein [Bacillota bacterium]
MYEINQLKKGIKQLLDSGNEALAKEILAQTHLIRKEMPGFSQIVKAQDIINKDGFDSTIYNDKPYLTTTENQRYLDVTIPGNASSACVILGAGDTVFELLSRGINKIVALDINELQLLIYRLKKASIMTLSAKDYESFLIDCNSSKFLSKKVFGNIKDGFNQREEDAYYFWKTILEVNPSEDIAKHLFKGLIQPASKIRFALPYLGNKKNYYELRSKLEQADIQLEQTDVISYLQNTELTFDYIDITNILLFYFQLDCSKNFDTLQKRMQMLKTIYNERLNSGGTFVFDYWFGFTIESMYTYVPTNEIQKMSVNLYRSIYENLLEMFEIETHTISGIIEGIRPDKDTILLTRKKNNQ